jgi:hypothetical protein
MALHILIVDDDEGVRNMPVEMLHFASFLTTAANSGGTMRHVLAGED